jgi:putative nucleotidyltransferase with HDIG domain
MSEQSVLPGMSMEQQLAYARDLRRIYEVEREKRRELEAANHALAAANAEIAQRAEALQRAEQQLVAYARDVRRAYEAERDRRAELHAAYMTTVRLLAAAIETRDPYTGGHVDRVAELSVATGRELEWDEAQLQTLELGALLHDVGKIVVPTEILNKPGGLTPDERAVIERHPDAGVELIGDIEFPWDICPMVRHHHEAWDGSGYPAGLAGEQIPLAARILCVADVYDALASDRPYRPAFPHERTLAIMSAEAGTRLDPALFDLFRTLDLSPAPALAAA